MAAFAAGVTLPSNANAEATAGEMLANIDARDARSTIYTAFLTGTTNGLAWANTDLEDRGLTPLYCSPRKLAITLDQNIDILRQRVKESPELGTTPAGLAMLMALRMTFTCKD
jgi:hypothetical protein